MKESSEGTVGGNLTLPPNIAVKFGDSAMSEELAQRLANGWARWINEAIYNSVTGAFPFGDGSQRKP